MIRSLFCLSILFVLCGQASASGAGVKSAARASTPSSEPDSLADQNGWPTSRPTFTRVCRENMTDAVPTASKQMIRVQCGCVYTLVKASKKRVSGDLMESTLQTCESAISQNMLTSKQLIEFADQSAAAECGKDTDCKGDRICSNGTCVSPQTNSQALVVQTPLNLPKPLTPSTPPSTNSLYSPFLNPTGKVTLGNCHMGSCSWAKWLSVKVEQSTPTEQMLQVKFLGGSSEGGEDYPTSSKGINISWNSSPHIVKVTCSHTKASVTVDDQTDLLPLSVTANIPDVLFSSVSTYFEACHSDFASRPIEDTIKKYGYNVHLPEYEN